MTKTFEDLDPVEIGVELSECAGKVLDAPAHVGLLLFWLFLEGGRVAIFVGLEGVVQYLGYGIILALVIDRKLKEGHRHSLLVDLLELREGLDQEVVQVGAAMADVNQQLPRLENFLCKLEMLEAAAIFKQVVGGQVGMAVEHRDILAQRASQWRELTEPVGISLDDKLLGLTELEVLLKLRDSIKQVQDTVDRVFRKLLRLPIYMKLDELLAEDFQQVGNGSLITPRLDD